VVRLLRLIRLARSDGIQDILNIYKVTVAETSHWLVMFSMIGGIVLIVFASFENIAEMGQEVAFANCDEQSSYASCMVSNPLFDLNVTSTALCKLPCEEYGRGGCCEFDLWTGTCRLYNSTEVINSSFFSYAGLCYSGENLLRRDGLKTPYRTVTESFWWACVTILMVGYGEIYPYSELGRIVASLAAVLGLFFIVLPVIVVGFHFTLAQLVQRYMRLPAIVDSELKANQRGTVIQLLEQVNEDMGTRLFRKEDVAVFLIQDTQINTKQKLEQILRYKNGWCYLPFSYDDTPGLPRVTQFKLFVLFTVFGRKFQRYRSAKKRDDQAFIKGLKILMEKKDLRGNDGLGISTPRRFGSKGGGGNSRSRSEPVNYGPLKLITDNADPKVIRMSNTPGASTPHPRMNISESNGPSVINLGLSILDSDEVSSKRVDSPQRRGSLRDYSSPRKLADFFNISDGEVPYQLLPTSTSGSHRLRRGRLNFPALKKSSYAQVPEEPEGHRKRVSEVAPIIGTVSRVKTTVV